MAGPANKSSQLIDERRVRLAERGIAEMTVDLYRSFAEPLSDETLFRWHRIVMSGSRGLRDVGHYRSGAEPMQVVPGPIGVPGVHFAAGPSSGVPSKMERFIPGLAGLRTAAKSRCLR